MKKTILSVIVGWLIMVNLIGIAWAQEATESSDTAPGLEMVKEKIEIKRQASEEHREEIRTRISELKDKVATKQAELKEKLAEQVRNRVSKKFTQMVKRMRAAVTRLENIMNRIDTRLEKLADKGVKTEEMEATLVQARAKLQQAEDILDAADAEFEDQVLNSESFREGFAAIKETVGQFQTQIKEVHGLMRDIVREMRVANGQIQNVTESE